MTAPASTKLQVNYKTPSGTLINLYGDNPDELVAEITALESLAGTIVSLEETFRAASLAAGPQTPSAQQPTQGWNNNPAPVQPGGFSHNEQQPQPAWGQQGNVQGGAKSCRHGAMQWKEGTSKTSGKPYKGWFCPSRDRNDQCSPEFVR